MAERESKEASQLGDHPAYGEAPPGPETNSWDRHLVSTLPFLSACILVWQLMERWFPWYLAMGIGCFVGGLVSFRFRDQRERHYGFVKYVVLYLLVAAGLSLLASALEALYFALFRK